MTANEHSVEEQAQDIDDDDDDEGGDQERLEAVKGYLFDTYRVQNDSVIMLDDFIADLDFIFHQTRSDDASDERTLYQTLLKMPM